MTNILHKKDDGTIHATGTLEKRSPGDQVVQVLIYALIAADRRALPAALHLCHCRLLRHRARTDRTPVLFDPA